MEKVVIPVTRFCMVCDKETSMPTGYYSCKDGNILCFTCKQCYTAYLTHRYGKGEENAEHTLSEYKNKFIPFDFGGLWIVPKPGLLDSKGKPIFPFLYFLKKGIDKINQPTDYKQSEQA